MNNAKAPTADSSKSASSPWSSLYREPERYLEYEFPKVTVVIPTRNNSSSISRTLDSVLRQDYPDLQVIIVDAGSTDRTLEIVNSYKDPRLNVYLVYERALYDMLNKGIDLATGKYINFLYPGGYYLQQDTIQMMMAMAVENDSPHLVFAGALIGEEGQGVRVLFRPMEKSYLRLGHQPTSLESCWFRRDLFDRLGLFRGELLLRGGFDMMCRIVLDQVVRAVSTSRVVTDYDHRAYTRPMIMRHFWETLRVIWNYFGLVATIRWVFYQKDITRWLKAGLHSMRRALTGR